MRRAFLVVGIWVACAAAQAAPLRIGVSETILSLPLYVAESEGYFKKHGVDVEFVTCLGGNRCVHKMLAGETELSTATELPVVFNSFTHSNFGIVTSFVSTSNDLKVVARSSSKIDQPGKLKGKTLGYVKGSASHYLLDSVLVYSGIDPGSVKLKEIKPEFAIASLADAKVDALCIWEPFVSKIQENLGDKVQLVPIPKLYTETFNLIAVRSVLDARPREIERILLALKDSTLFIQEHPERAVVLAAGRLNVPVELIEKIFPDYRYRLTLNRSLLRTMEGQARWALREGHVKGGQSQPNYTNYIYPAFLKAIEASAVLLQ